jgi:hypothetical protein
VTLRGCTLAPLTRVYQEWRNRFRKISIDAFRTAYTHHEHLCMLEEEEKKRTVKQSWMHEIAKGTLIEHQMAMQLKMRGLLWCDSTRDHAHKRLLPRYLNASISIRKCLVLLELSADWFRAIFSRKLFRT